MLPQRLVASSKTAAQFVWVKPHRSELPTRRGICVHCRASSNATKKSLPVHRSILDFRNITSTPKQYSPHGARSTASLFHTQSRSRFPVIAASIDDKDGKNSIPRHHQTPESFLDSTELPSASPPIEDLRQRYRSAISNSGTDSKSLSDPEAIQLRQSYFDDYKNLVADPVLRKEMHPSDFVRVMKTALLLPQSAAKLRSVIVDLQETEHAENPIPYQVLLKAYIELSDYTSAEKLWRDMTQAGVELTPIGFHMMLNVWKSLGKVGMAKFLLKTMRERDCPIVTMTYTTMINLCGQARVPHLGREYFEEMPLLGLEQDLKCYNTMLNAYAMSRDLKNALRVWEEMEGEGFAPDAYSYASLIKIYIHERNYEAANLLRTEMNTRNVLPSVKVLAALLTPPLDIIKELRGLGVSISLHDYNLLIIQSLRNNQFELLPEILKSMREDKLQPDFRCYGAMVDAYCKAKEMDKAQDLFDNMRRVNIQPDVISYTGLIKGWMDDSQVLKAVKMLQQMLDDGLSPNVQTFNSLLAGGLGRLDIKVLDRIWASMKEGGVKPDTRSFNAMLSAYAVRSDMTQIVRMIADMKRMKVSMDRMTFSIAISGFLRNGDLRYAMEWYYDMIDKRFDPGTKLVNNLMAALLGSGERRQVILLFREMDQLKIFKSHQSYEIALKAAAREGLIESYRQIERELQERLVQEDYVPTSARRP